MGLNFNSKYRSGKLISMSQKFRYKDSRENYPGPGAYCSFSEFSGINYPQIDNSVSSIKFGNSIKLSPIKKKGQ